tara:strand:+ start:745 stop:4197 length:3453 start_codon:yes stop_codon:yes gene_type:complete
MAKLRLVAYRKPTSGATLDTTYELDLQEHPVVSLNFQFSDIKEPQTRKASYSQTFKLPFTDNNNKFFQNWFNVNLETLVFSAREKFDAALYVGTVPQFEGIIQLKSVYQKAQVYEVVLLSNSANLFSVIGENRLRDVFLKDNGSYSNELDHTYTHANIIASWNGASSSFQNTSGDSLRDATAGVQKVMYPMSIRTKRFWYKSDDEYYLNMPQSYIDAQGYENVVDRQSPITMFKPALQLKNMIKLILLKAGFTYRSSFIDGAYFGKLFMTTANHIETTSTTSHFLPTTNTTETPAFTTVVAHVGAAWGVFEDDDESMPGLDVPIPEQDITVTVPANTTSDYDCIQNAQNVWNSTENYFTKEFGGLISIQVEHRLHLRSMSRSNSEEPVVLKVWMEDTSNPDITYGEMVYYNVWGIETVDTEVLSLNHYLDISEMSIGASAYIKMTLQNIEFASTTSFIKYGAVGTAFGCDGDLKSLITITAIPYSQGIYNGTINIPACIDEDILQKDFLLDIVQRFNLLIVVNPDNVNELIIEPYNDYLADGEIKHWTDKIDTSKEIIVKDTTSLMKKRIHFSDLDDEDLMNKAVKEEDPLVSVYGHYKQTDDTNQFASGELKNDPIFSPYINHRVFRWNGTTTTELPNMAVQYEYSYNEDGGTEYPKTKPKLFYYNGTATTVKNGNGDTLTYYMHNQVAALEEITAYSFTTYPLCTPFDITPSSDAYTLTAANKSLYWNANPPVVGELDVFNYSSDTASWFANTLYGLYWKAYLDGIYDPDARIMECHLNLDQVDIYNFKFNDEIFIKDAYWRVLEIKNYQVGAKTSTKVVMLKVIDTFSPCVNCSYVIGEDSSGSNMYNNGLYYWCPDSDPDCTPITDAPYTGLLAPTDCCECHGGMSITWMGFSTGLFPCLANGGSLPINLKSMLGLRSILSQGQMKSIIYDKLRGEGSPFVIGSNNGKFANSILPPYADDMVIKYKTEQKNVPRLEGEMHRIVATGYTEGNTRGYAYPAGTKYNLRPFVPSNSNMIIRITGTATVIGGTSATYPVGTTEGFSWYTAFKNVNGTITQLSTAGGLQEFSITEGPSIPTTCTLYITTSNGELQFGLDDSQTDTKRIWSLTIDLAVQRLPNIAIPYGENWAIFQNASNIQFMNYDFMLWN